MWWSWACREGAWLWQRKLPATSEAYLEQERRKQQEEIRRRVQRYRKGRPPVPLAGKRVILVDDGIEAPEYFWAVGMFYEDFHQISDTEVEQLLQELSWQ